MLVNKSRRYYHK